MYDEKRRRGELAAAREDGRAEGLAQGLAEGRAEERFEMARKFKALGGATLTPSYRRRDWTGILSRDYKSLSLHKTLS